MATISRPPLIVRIGPQSRIDAAAWQTQPLGTAPALTAVVPSLPVGETWTDYRVEAPDRRAAIEGQAGVTGAPLALIGLQPAPFAPGEWQSPVAAAFRIQPAAPQNMLLPDTPPAAAPPIRQWTDYDRAGLDRGAALRSQDEVSRNLALIALPSPFVRQEIARPIGRRTVQQPADATNLLPIGVSVEQLLTAQRAIDQRFEAPDRTAAIQSQPLGRSDHLYAVPFSGAALFVPHWRRADRGIRVDAAQSMLALLTAPVAPPFALPSVARPVVRDNPYGAAIGSQPGVDGVRLPLRREYANAQARSGAGAVTVGGGSAGLSAARSGDGTASARGAVGTATGRSAVGTATARSADGTATQR